MRMFPRATSTSVSIFNSKIQKSDHKCAGQGE